MYNRDITNNETTKKENKMNDDNINACISDLTDNFDLDTLLDYASSDDGAYTVQDHGADWPIVTIDAALTRIADLFSNTSR